jgi:hypothetical protein
MALGGWTFSAALIVMGSLLAAPLAIAVGAGLTIMCTRSLLRWAPRGTAVERVPLRLREPVGLAGTTGAHGRWNAGAQGAWNGTADAGRARGGHHGARHGSGRTRARRDAYCGPEWVAPAPPVSPLGARRRRILAGLEAMARRSTFPGEAAAFRAKAEQLRRSVR